MSFHFKRQRWKRLLLRGQ